MTDFRALCEELLAAIEDDSFFRTNDALRFCKAVLSARTALADEDSAFLRTNNALRSSKAVPSAHAALAEQPVGPTRKEAVDLYSEMMAAHDCQTLGEMAEHFARAVLAASDAAICACG